MTMKAKMLALLLCALLPCIAATTAAKASTPPRQEITVNGWLYELDGDALTATLVEMVDPRNTDGNAPQGVFTIPETIEADGVTYRVTALGELSGERINETLTGLMIPSSVTTVHARSFCGLNALKELEIPETVIHIPDGLTMQNCKALERLVIKAPLTKLANSFASGAESLTSVVLPSTLTAIDPYPFSDSPKLTTITFGDVPPVEGMAAIPDHVTIIGEGAFSGTGLAEVVLPAGTTKLNIQLFDGCTNLRSVTINGGGKLTEIGRSAFSGCASLTVVPDMSLITAIPPEAFYECESLALPGTLDMSRVTSVGDKAFSYCYAFEGDLNLESAEEIGIWAFLGVDISSVRFGSSLKNLPEFAFAWCYKLAQITIPEGLEAIGYSAFEEMAATSLQLPNSLRTIGADAFLNCSQLQTVTIGSDHSSRLEKVEADAFANSSKDIAITVHSSRQVIDGANNLPNATYTVESVEAADDRISDEPGAPTLQQAVDAAPDGGTVLLSKNILLDTGILIPGSKHVTLRAADGKAVHILADPNGFTGPMFTVPAGGGLTLGSGLTLWGRGITTPSHSAAFVDCGGSLELRAGAALQYASVDADSSAAVRVYGQGGRLTMSGGSIAGNSFSSQYGGAVLVTEGAAFEMTGGEICRNDTDVNTIRINSAPVYVDASGPSSFVMRGGRIADNRGAHGGVLVGEPTPAAANATAIATMTLYGGEISGNTATGTGGGGIMVAGPASLAMHGGEIARNTAITGGGIAVYDLYTSFGQGGDFEGWKQTCPAAFTMTGGIVRGNEAAFTSGIRDGGCGGGIYIASDNVALRAGEVTGNAASRQGGGVYVGSTPYTLHMYDALITQNTATALGGGMWFCPTGEAVNTVTSGGAIFDNTVYNAQIPTAGDDIAAVAQIGYSRKTTLADRMLGGGEVQWYKDGGIDHAAMVGNINLGTANRDPRYDPATGERMTSIREWTSTLALKAIVTDGAKALAGRMAKLRITQNTAQRGGGLGSNGAVVIGEQGQEWTLRVEKEWAAGVTDAQKAPVSMRLWIGDLALDAVTLSAEGGWAAEFAQLPDPRTLGDLKIAVLEEGGLYDAAYSELTTDEGAKLLYVKITNSLKPTPVPTPSPTPTPTASPEPPPQTGDPADPLGWIALMCAAAIALTGAVYARGRHRRGER